MRQHVPMNRWVGGIGFVILYLLNDHFLVDRGRGTAFEQQFRSFRATKQTILYVAAIGIILASGITVYLSVATYHQTFNLR
jgi:hypothetical protein